MTKKQSARQRKQRLSAEDIILLDKVISGLSLLILFDNHNILSHHSKEYAKNLESRLNRRRSKLTGISQEKTETEISSFGKKFFEELIGILDEFVRKEGLGVEYDKRLAAGILPAIRLIYQEIAK